MQRLIVWDGNNLFHRAYGNKGLARLSFRGTPTGAVHGTVKWILEDIDRMRPHKIAVVFDGADSRRSKQKLLESYKAHRATSKPEDHLHQLLMVKSILEAAGVPVVHIKGMDADDAIAAIVRAHQDTHYVRVISNDKDFLQLVNKTVQQIRNCGNGPEVWTAGKVKEAFGLRPNQMADFLALAGDQVDGIPGLHRCGPKTATALLKEHGSLAAILRAKPKRLGDMYERVDRQREDLKTYQKLVSLDHDGKAAKRLVGFSTVPRKYRSTLFERCTALNLQYLAKWFNSHRPCVVAVAGGLWN